MTRPTRKPAGSGLGAFQNGETLDLDQLVVSSGLFEATISGTLATVTTDLQNGPLQKLTLENDLGDWVTSNRVNGASVRIVVDPGASSRALAFSSSWVWIGAMPSTIAANKIGVLDLTLIGTAETDVLAQWDVEA